MLTIDHMAAEVDILLPTSGSCGQLLVYESSVSPGRLVAAAHEVQKKNAVSAWRSALSGSAPSVIAYWPRRTASAGSVPNRSSKCRATSRMACARSLLTVTTPVDGTSYGNGAIAVEGTTTNAKSVSVTATYLGKPGTPASSAAPAPRASGQPSQGTTIDVASDGSFEFPPLELTAGRWAITVTATSDQGQTASLTRNVEVAFSGVNLVVTIKGSPAWIKVWVDGKLVGPQSGRVFDPGKTLTFHGTSSVEIRTGSSGATQFTLNGTSLGSLGKSGIPETWLFKPPDPPVKTQRT